MKKIISTILIVLSLIIGVNKVNAYHYHKQTLNAVDSGSAVLLCDYYDPNDPNGNDKGEKIYYHFKVASVDWQKMGSVDIFYKKGKSWNDLYAWYDTNEILSYGYFDEVFVTKSNRISKDKKGNKFPVGLEKNFTCPGNSFTDFDNLDEICFSDKTSCGSDFKNGPFPLQPTETTIFNVILKYASDTVYTELKQEHPNVKDFLNFDFKTAVVNKTMTYTNNKYNFGTKYTMPEFIQAFINNVTVHAITVPSTPSTPNTNTTNSSGQTTQPSQPSEAEQNWDELMEDIEEEADAALERGEITQEEHDEIVNNTKKSYAQTMKVNTSGIGVNPSNDPDCHGLLGEQMTEVINNIFSAVQYCGPVLVAVFTIVDLIKAVASGSQEDMKKAKDKFVKRVIAAALLFFVPLICNMLFSIAGITLPDNCIGD